MADDTVSLKELDFTPPRDSSPSENPGRWWNVLRRRGYRGGPEGQNIELQLHTDTQQCHGGPRRHQHSYRTANVSGMAAPLGPAASEPSRVKG